MHLILAQATHFSGSISSRLVAYLPGQMEILTTLYTTVFNSVASAASARSAMIVGSSRLTTRSAKKSHLMQTRSSCASEIHSMWSPPCSISGAVRHKECRFRSKISTQGSPMHGRTSSSKRCHAGVTSTTFGSRRPGMRAFLFTSSALRISLATQKVPLWTCLPSRLTRRALKALLLRKRSIF